MNSIDTIQKELRLRQLLRNYVGDISKRVSDILNSTELYSAVDKLEYIKSIKEIEEYAFIISIYNSILI